MSLCPGIFYHLKHHICTFPLLEAGNALVAVCRVTGAGGAKETRPWTGPESWKGRLLVLISTSFPGTLSPNTQRDTALRSGGRDLRSRKAGLGLQRLLPKLQWALCRGGPKRMLTRQGRDQVHKCFATVCLSWAFRAAEQPPPQ